MVSVTTKVQQENLANAKGSARQCPMVNCNTVPAAAENGVFFITWRPLVNRNTIPALCRKLRIFHTPLLFGASAPYLPFGIAR